MPLLLPSEYSPEALRADVALVRANRDILQMQLITLQEGLNLQRSPILKNPTTTDYRVGEFETLPQVSARIYSSPDYWPEIAAANNLEYPYIIVPGQVLTIPAINDDERV